MEETNRMGGGNPFPWEFDPKLRDHLMHHGHHFLNLQLFQDIRDRELMMVCFLNAYIYLYISEIVSRT
jgi:hypothetical protein